MSFALVDLETNDRGLRILPQGQASVLCDNDFLRLSVWNNREYLFVQTAMRSIRTISRTIGRRHQNQSRCRNRRLVRWHPRLSPRIGSMSMVA